MQRDITERRKTEDAIRKSEEQFRTLTQSLPQLIWTTDKEGAVEFFNQQWYNYTGSKPEESLGYNWSQYLHQDDANDALEKWQHSLQTGKILSTELRVRANDGSYKWFIVTGNPIKNNEGEIIKWLGTVTDIDERKKWEETLRLSERRYSSLIQASTSIFFLSVISLKYHAQP